VATPVVPDDPPAPSPSPLALEVCAPPAALTWDGPEDAPSLAVRDAPPPAALAWVELEDAPPLHVRDALPPTSSSTPSSSVVSGPCHHPRHLSFSWRQLLPRLLPQSCLTLPFIAAIDASYAIYFTS